ncbi:MAG TPA: DUF4389 domain-containing protein [Beutenbergiaceae bacterium]|nr:DUF4389 domain-containing protein [Beutenbergiaceae bacterium]
MDIDVRDTPEHPARLYAWAGPDRPSRWLWLVKWVLVIPHVLILIGLWIAAWVLMVFAFFAVLITGRYPRGVFDFNVGVLRWSWRVGYYAYSALGTDRYPPFSLADDQTYPAGLQVDHPARLSRGLVLIKWWLLALPHYLLLVFFLGAGARAARQVDGLQWMWEGGLIALLVFFVGVALLFTGSYPQGLYRLLVGLNRWVFRVVAYAGLLTDAYPPFRLDQGGPEPAGPSPGPPGAPDPTAAAASPAPVHAGSAPPYEAPAGSGQPAPGSEPPGPGPAPPGPGSASPGPGSAPLAAGAASQAPGASASWTPGRVVSVVVGAVLLVLGLLSLGGGIALLVGQATARQEGFLTTPTWEVDSLGYAVVSDELELQGGDVDEVVGDIWLQVAGQDELFLGVAQADDAATYLQGVARTERTSTLFERDIPGGPPAMPPGEAGIWIDSASGTGEVELVLPAEPGRFVVVVMSPDGQAGVHGSIAAGAALPWIQPVGIAAVVGGGVLIAAGVLLIVFGVRAASRKEAS